MNYAEDASGVALGNVAASARNEVNDVANLTDDASSEIIPPSWKDNIADDDDVDPSWSLPKKKTDERSKTVAISDGIWRDRSLLPPPKRMRRKRDPVSGELSFPHASVNDGVESPSTNSSETVVERNGTIEMLENARRERRTMRESIKRRNQKKKYLSRVLKAANGGAKEGKGGGGGGGGKSPPSNSHAKRAQKFLQHLNDEDESRKVDGRVEQTAFDASRSGYFGSESEQARRARKFLQLQGTTVDDAERVEDPSVSEQFVYDNQHTLQDPTDKARKFLQLMGATNDDYAEEQVEEQNLSSNQRGITDPAEKARKFLQLMNQS